MPDIPDEILLDKRLVTRHIRQGLITEEEVKRRLETAEDVEDLGESMDLDALENEVLSRGRPVKPGP